MSDYITVVYCQTESGYFLAKMPTFEYVKLGDNVVIDFYGTRVVAEVLNTADFKIGSEQYELLFEIAGVEDMPKVVKKMITMDMDIKWEDEDERTN